MTEAEKAERERKMKQMLDTQTLFVETMKAYDIDPSIACVSFLALACAIFRLAEFDLPTFVQMAVAEFTNGEASVNVRTIEPEDVRRALRIPGRRRVLRD